MGTMITLGVGKLEISWGKNNIFDNFCDLFQPEDWKDIKYYYADNIVETKKGYSRNLSLVKPRLDLLGYTLIILKTYMMAYITNTAMAWANMPKKCLLLKSILMCFQELTYQKSTH